MLGNYLEHSTSADVIFTCVFFFGALRVKPIGLVYRYQQDEPITNLRGVGGIFHIFSNFNTIL